MEQFNRAIAIVGFPQAGKSALKTRLEAVGSAGFQILELPGVFMLGRNTPAEEETYDYLLGRSMQPERPPEGIIAVAQAAHLERQLYLVFQLIDLRLPLLLYITGEKEAGDRGIAVNLDRLAEQLGVKVLAASTEDVHLQSMLVDWQAEEKGKIKRQPAHWRPSQALADAYQHLDVNWIHKHLPLYTGARLVEGLRLLTVPKAIDEYESHPAYRALLRNLEEAREILEKRNEKWTMAEVIQRTNWIGQVVDSSVTKTFIQKPATNGARKWWPFPGKNNGDSD